MKFLSPIQSVLLLCSSFAAAQSVTTPVISASPPAASSQAPAQAHSSGTRPTTPDPASVSDSSSTAPGPGPAPIPIPSSSVPYIIGPGDTIAVTVWREPGLSGSFPVRPDGMISLSLVGDLTAAGFTPPQLSTDIAVRLKKFVNEPNVTVTVLSFHIKEVFLIGEVMHVGAVPITPEMTPLQAIAAAGGLSPFAKSKHIYILRKEQGKQSKIAFDYKKALKDGNQQGVSLLAGDTIVVP